MGKQPLTTGEGVRAFVTFRLARVQNQLNAQASNILRDLCDLSLTEWRVVSLVHALKETTATVISREAQMDKGQISRAVKSLVKNGYLNAATNERDSRLNILSLEQKGIEVFDKVVEVMKARQVRLTSEITADELDVFYSVLDKLEAQTKTR
jgi:DNA-binding MarR family transcriptional regulator